jgi:hypothetical protein
LLRTLPGNRTSLRVSPPTSSLFWRTRVDRISRMVRQTPLILSTWRPTEIREWARRTHGIFSNGKPAVVNSSCTTATSESRASTAPGEPLSQSCKRPLRSAALRRSGKPSKILSLERLVGGRIVRAQSVWWEKTRSQRFQLTGVFNNRSLWYSLCLSVAAETASATLLWRDFRGCTLSEVCPTRAFDRAARRDKKMAASTCSPRRRQAQSNGDDRFGPVRHPGREIQYRPVPVVQQLDGAWRRGGASALLPKSSGGRAGRLPPRLR